MKVSSQPLIIGPKFCLPPSHIHTTLPPCDLFFSDIFLKSLHPLIQGSSCHNNEIDWCNMSFWDILLTDIHIYHIFSCISQIFGTKIIHKKSDFSLNTRLKSELICSWLRNAIILFEKAIGLLFKWASIGFIGFNCISKVFSSNG